MLVLPIKKKWYVLGDCAPALRELALRLERGEDDLEEVR